MTFNSSTGGEKQVRERFSELYNPHIVTDQTVLDKLLIPAVSEDTTCL